MPERLRLVRPQLAVQPGALRTIVRSLVVLECVPSGLPLRGQLLPVEPADSLVFVGTPMVRALADLKRSGLSLDDWPPNDAVADLLFLLQSKDVALTEARALSDRLSRQREELRIAVRERGEAQAAASAREASLRAILDTAPDGIVTIDERGITSKKAAEDPCFEALGEKFKVFVDLMSSSNAYAIITTPFSLELNDAMAAAEEEILHTGADAKDKLDALQAEMEPKFMEAMGK